jgi:dTDP-glucose 4,6-dehydratase
VRLRRTPQVFPTIGAGSLRDSINAANDRVSGLRDWIHVKERRRDRCGSLRRQTGSRLQFRRRKRGGECRSGEDDSEGSIKLESFISYVIDRLGHDRRYAIDSSFAQRELKWKPRRSSKEGLEEPCRGTSTISLGGNLCLSGPADIDPN